MNCHHCGELLVRVDYPFGASQERYHISDTEWDKDNPPTGEDPGVLVPKSNALPYPHCDKDPSQEDDDEET
jgi:hypothetical protein